MQRRSAVLIAFVLAMLVAPPAFAAVIYNNLTPNNQMAMASRPDIGGVTEIESADDFVLASRTIINSASFTGLIVPSGATTPSVSALVVEIYRVFPADSNTVRTPNVPTRANSPSDVALDSRMSGSDLSFTSSTLAASFTANNSVKAGGIHLATGGNGPVTGSEVQFDVTFTTPFDLPADHYFFVPQVAVSGGDFLWLSASRPISGAGTTPFAPDLQTWNRDEALDPDWLRTGTDIVDGATPPTFNAAFALQGTAVPEPSTLLLVVSGIAGMATRLGRRGRGVR